MKLPDKNDPGGDYEGRLPRANVLQTLRDNGVLVQSLGGDMYLLTQGDELMAQIFNEYIGGLMVRRLAKTFKIHGVEFYYDPLTGQRKNDPE